MSARRTVFFAVFGLLLFAATSAQAEIVERIAAVVNDKVILLSEVNEALANTKAMLSAINDPGARMQKERELRQRVMNTLIEDLLIEQQMEELNLKISEREVDQSIKMVMERNNIPDLDTLKEALKSQGLSWEDYRKAVTKQMQKSQFINAKVGYKVKISDEEVRQAYEKEAAQEAEEFEYHARHILFRVTKDDPPTQVEEQKRKTEEALARLRAGEDFEKLAEELSGGQTSKIGGDLGFFRRGVMVREFEDAVVGLKVGEVSQPVRSNFGFHLIQLIEKRPVPVKTFEEIKGEIFSRLREEQLEREMSTWLTQLRKKAYIKIFLDLDSPSGEARP